MAATTTSARVETSPFPPGRKRWHKTAPAAVVRAGDWGPNSDGWTAWARHLERRRRPAAASQAYSGRTSPLRWGLALDALTSETRLLIEQITALGRRRGAVDVLAEELPAWLAEACDAAPSMNHGLECLAWSHGLVRLAEAAPADLWWELLGYLVETAASANGVDLNDDPLAHQLLAGELPLTLADQFPELRACRDLAAAGRAAVTHGMRTILDGEGLTHARRIDVSRPLTACWTRAYPLGARLKLRDGWDEVVPEQLAWAMRQLLRWSRADGTQMLSVGASTPWDREWISEGLRQVGDREDRAVAAKLVPKLDARAASRRARLPLASYESEWAEAALLKSSWSRTSPTLAIASNLPTHRVEFASGGEVFWSGAWRTEIQFNGRSLEPSSGWEQVCWVSDDDGDYIELRADFPDGAYLERQVLLAREDEFLFLADAFHASERGAIDYRGVLPLAADVCFEPAAETSEGALLGAKRRANVLPLALPEWRSAARDGALEATDEGLCLRQSAEARALYAPWLFDLNTRRQRRGLTWRLLTVGEDRAAVPPDVAVGYRVQLASRQWLFYRSLSACASRTVLGHNLTGEFLAARFERGGEVDALLEIE